MTEQHNTSEDLPIEGNIIDNLNNDMQEVEGMESNPQNDANSTNNNEGTSNNNSASNSNKQEALYLQEIKDLKDKYLRLYAEFDTARRRFAREKIELGKTAGREIIVELLPILDDFERAFKLSQNADNKGFELIYNKLKNNLESKGLKPMEAIGQVFDPDLHEAITEIPAPTPQLSGKVIDEVERGYYLNDVIIRYAKVVVGK